MQPGNDAAFLGINQGIQFLIAGNSKNDAPFLTPHSLLAVGAISDVENTSVVNYSTSSHGKILIPRLFYV